MRKDERNDKFFGRDDCSGDSVWSVAFFPDGQLLTSGSADETIKLLDVA